MDNLSTFRDMVETTEEQRKVFFKLAFGPNNSGYVCISYIKHPDGNAYNKFFEYPGEIDVMCENINAHCEQLVHVYFSSCLYEKAGSREKQYVKYCPNIWCDLDTTDPRLLLKEPSILNQTSPGKYQALWLLENPLLPADAEDIARRIAYYHADDGADKCWDAGHLLRVPYTPNLKYGDLITAPIVTIITAKRSLHRTGDFDGYPRVAALEFTKQKEIPKLPPERAEVILERYREKLPSYIYEIFRTTPPDDNEKWSGALWRLMKLCIESGMRREETFVVAGSSACNKYARDRRPETELWQDVQRCYVKHIEKVRLAPTAASTIPDLITEVEIKKAQGRETFIERYIQWAQTRTDASVQYHQSGAFMALSSLLAGNITLHTSFGRLVPNLWFLLLADTTLTRKAQPLDAKIMTPNGWRMMGEIKVGDFVTGKNGKATKVIGVFPQGIKDSYKVTFGDGASTECSLDHLWTHKRPGSRSEYSTWSLREIKNRNLQDENGTWVRQIPMVEPVNFEEKNLPIDPYLLGILLGNGTFEECGSIKFTGVDKELLEYIGIEISKYNLTLNEVGNAQITYHISSNGDRWNFPNYISSQIKILGLNGKRSWEKFIPTSYLLGSVDQRIALLRGLMDTDGWVGIKRSTSFSSSSKQLMEDVKFLVQSLGGWCQYDNGKEAGYKDIDGNYIQCRDSHRIGISMPIGINPFSLKRKASRLDDRSWARPRSMRKIEFVGPKPMQCIRVESEDGLYVTDDFIVTHNTTAMNLSMSLIQEVNDDALMATDGSPEGIFVAMRDRPHQPSIFQRDEFTGMLEAIAHKDYMAGFSEQLTKLYDGDSLKRLLRKETIYIKEPVFLIYAAGTKSRAELLLTEDMVMSGFIPRFIVITAEPDFNGLQPVGPPLDKDIEHYESIKNELIDLHLHYSAPTEIKQNGRIIGTAPTDFKATLTPAAWTRYNEYEKLMMKTAFDTGLGYLTPVYDRLCKSTLKAAILIAASVQRDNKVVVDIIDIVHAIYYAQGWREYASKLVNGIGKPYNERIMDKILQFIRASRTGVTRGELMNVFMLDVKRADIIFTTLEQRKAIFKVDVGTDYRYQSLD